MLWDNTDLKKYIKETEGIEYDENIFMPVDKKTKVIDFKVQTISYMFLHNPTWKTLVVPFMYKLEFVKFLKSWDIKDLPKWQKLIW